MLDKNKTYLVLNYNGSPVAVSTRHESYIIPGGSSESPSSMPLSVDEIVQINSNSNVFKMGLLWFEEEVQEELYKECRIRNWENILRDKEIEDIILHPTLEKLEKLLSIENEQYFERCYGIYIGLKNSNHSIKQNVENVMLARRKELRNRKYKTGILLTKKETNVVSEEALKETQEQNVKLTKEVDELKAMVAQLLAAQQNSAPATAEAENADKDTETKATDTTQEPKKATRGRPKKNS
ncbi:MAG: hypothetical protein SPK49_02700 [Erysipelotrichaceae bacterium]|nr:hypothetical protein [Erysipelotrichaceae bacterium]